MEILIIVKPSTLTFCKELLKLRGYLNSRSETKILSILNEVPYVHSFSIFLDIVVYSWVIDLWVYYS